MSIAVSVIVAAVPFSENESISFVVMAFSLKFSGSINFVVQLIEIIIMNKIDTF